MGEKPTKLPATGGKSYEKRDVPLSVDDLKTDRQAPSDQPAKELDLSVREYDNYTASLEAYERARVREADLAAKEKAVNLFKSGWYTTSYKQRKDAEGEIYFEVTTGLNAKVVSGGYVNRFYPDGTIMAESNYHYKPEFAEHTGDLGRCAAKTLLISNSNILACQRQFLVAKGCQLAPVDSLVRCEVSNERTCDTARACFLISAKMTVFPAAWDCYWDLDTDCARALLGTPNGLAAIYLVKDWGTELGLAGIHLVEVVKSEPITNRQVNVTINFMRQG